MNRYQEQRNAIAADLATKFNAEIGRIQKVKVEHFSLRLVAGENDESDNIVLDKAWKELRRTADALEFYADLVKRTDEKRKCADPAKT